jgi:hypothetical protein
MLVMSHQVSSATGVSVQTMQEIVKRIPMLADWDSIKVNGDQEVSNSVVLWYKTSPQGLSKVETDTKYIASYIIKALIALGHDPKTDWNGIRVNAMQGGFTTVTGRPAVKWFGGTDYEYSDDALVWSPR